MTKAGARVCCVIDCGTVQVRAYIVEIDGQSDLIAGGKSQVSPSYHILENLERDVDCSDALRGGTLNRLTMDHIEHAIQDIVHCARAYGVADNDIKAVGTSAMRECINADAVVEWVLQRTGVEIQVIDSAEEARLYFAALRRLWWEESRSIDDAPLLMLDIGSGATVTSLIDGGKLVHSVDEHFGTIRVFEQFQGLTDSSDFVATVDRFTHGAVRMILRRLPQRKLTELVVTGGEVRDLAHILDRTQDRLHRIELRQLEEWLEPLRNISRPAQARLLRVDSQHADRILLAASVLTNLMRETDMPSVTVPEMRLRDGLVADQLPGSLGERHLDREQVLGMAQMLSQRFGMEAAYAQNTAELATQIFDQTADLHRLSDRDRTLLEFAALVHDIGAYINVRNRHKHSMYLLHSVDLPGLDGVEVEIVSHVVRYHRRAVPQLNHHEFQALGRSVRIRIMILAAILRLAYGLDVERTQRIRNVRCEVSQGRLLMHVDRRQIALERWSIASKSQMFMEVFGLQVVLLPRGGD